MAESPISKRRYTVYEQLGYVCCQDRNTSYVCSDVTFHVVCR